MRTPWERGRADARSGRVPGAHARSQYSRQPAPERSLLASNIRSEAEFGGVKRLAQQLAQLSPRGRVSRLMLRVGSDADHADSETPAGFVLTRSYACPLMNAASPRTGRTCPGPSTSTATPFAPSAGRKKSKRTLASTASRTDGGQCSQWISVPGIGSSSNRHTRRSGSEPWATTPASTSGRMAWTYVCTAPRSSSSVHEPDEAYRIFSACGVKRSQISSGRYPEKRNSTWNLLGPVIVRLRIFFKLSRRTT